MPPQEVDHLSHVGVDVVEEPAVASAKIVEAGLPSGVSMKRFWDTRRCRRSGPRIRQ